MSRIPQNHRAHAAAAAAALLWFGVGHAGGALAQDAGDSGGAAAEPALESAEDLGFSSTAMTPPPPPPVAVAPERWGTRFLDRPRTLPAGMFELGGYLDYARYPVTSATGTSLEASTTASAVVGYGLTDQLELRTSYTASLDPANREGPFSIAAALSFSEGDLAIAVGGDFTYDLVSEVGGIGVGARVRYKVTRDLGLYTQRQLVMAVIGDGAKAAELHLPLGAGYQVNDHLYLFAETELAQRNLQHSESLTLLVDYLPLTLGAVFARSSRLEFGGTLYTDLENSALDALELGAFARAYL